MQFKYNFNSNIISWSNEYSSTRMNTRMLISPIVYFKKRDSSNQVWDVDCRLNSSLSLLLLANIMYSSKRSIQRLVWTRLLGIVVFALEAFRFAGFHICWRRIVCIVGRERISITDCSTKISLWTIRLHRRKSNSYLRVRKGRNRMRLSNQTYARLSKDPPSM